MYSRSKLEKLLRQAKVTTQSIQKVSQWILLHRQHLHEIVAQWAALIREREPEHQIVYFYVANDAMQVGVRKFGRHIAAAFEDKLVDIVQFVMTEGEEKVKRCIIKIVGIWKERGVVTPSLLAMLENVCAGKPAVEQVPEADAKPEETLARMLQEMTREAAVERVLEDMPEVVEAAATTQVATHLQDLVNATISADMLSDRMFQLESSLSVFHHACAEQDEEDDDEVVVVGEEENRTYPATGGVAWSKMDQQVYDLDVDSSRIHVEQYRRNLTDQAAKREALIKKLRSLESTDLFSFPRGAIAIEEAELQEQALERLYGIACEAETVEMKQLEAQRAEFRARQASLAASIADPLYTGYQATEDPYRAVTPTTSTNTRASEISHVSYRRSSYQSDEPQQYPPVLRRHSSASAATDRGFTNDRYNNQDRHMGQIDQYGGQRDRYGEHSGQYGVDSLSTSKRPKLHHAHSMEPQNLQWQDASRRSPPRVGPLPNPYAAMERQQLPYSPRDTIYSPRDQYHAPPPQPRPGRRTRWDSVSDDRSKSHFNEPRW